MANHFNLLSEVASLGKGITVESIQAEINALTELIDKAVGEESEKLGFDVQPLKDRVDKCIFILEQAKQELAARQTVRTKKNLLASLEKSKPEGYVESLVEAKESLKLAQQALDEVKSQVRENASRQDIRWAIMEGYTIVTLLREKIVGEKIDYKIMTTGVDGSGQEVLLEAQPTLAEVLMASKLDPTSMSVRLTVTQHQFKKMLQDLDQSDSVRSLRNSVLSKMKRVQLDNEQAKMWDTFVAVREGLDTIDGARTNFGQLTESFVEYMESDEEVVDTLDTIYSLLEKGRNNLAYYLGADINASSLWQVKALSVHGSTGRADVATLTNVLNPLKEISSFLGTLTGGALTLALKQFFTPSDGQGDRPFDEKVGEKVKEQIAIALGNMNK